MSEILALTLLAAASLISLVALFVVMQALFPGIVAASQRLADATPARALGVGFVNLLFAAALALGFIALAEGLGIDEAGVPLALLLLFVGFGLHLGLTSVARLIGARLNPEWTPLQRTVRGGVALALAALLPGVGWFIVFPYALLLGFGALILALWERRAQA